MTSSPRTGRVNEGWNDFLGRSVNDIRAILQWTNRIRIHSVIKNRANVTKYEGCSWTFRRTSGTFSTGQLRDVLPEDSMLPMYRVWFLYGPRLKEETRTLPRTRHKVPNVTESICDPQTVWEKGERRPPGRLCDKCRCSTYIRSIQTVYFTL